MSFMPQLAAQSSEQLGRQMWASQRTRFLAAYGDDGNSPARTQLVLSVGNTACTLLLGQQSAVLPCIGNCQ